MVLYAQYVAKIRHYTTKLNLNDAVECAIKECIAEGILAEFLQKNRAEVKMLSILEYDKEWEEEKLRKAEFEAGVEEAEARIIQNMKRRGDSMQAIVEAIGKHLIQKRQAPFGYLSIRFINPAISSGSGMTRNAPFLVVITDAAALAKQSISCILCSVSPSMPYSNT